MPVSSSEAVSDGGGAGKAHTIYLRLRELAAEDSRQARREFTTLLEAAAPELDYILLQAAAAGEGRLRHIMANAVRSHPAKARAVEHLEQWLEVETDAFARRAIEDALRGHPHSMAEGRIRPYGPDQFPHQIARTYRYVAGQLRHEVRNALIEVQTPLRELRIIAESLAAMDPSHSRLVEQINLARIGLRNAGRLVEFETGEGDEYFSERIVTLCDWLKNRSARYAETTSVPITLNIEASPGARSATIRANDHLLDIIFRNVWNNARQSSGDPCIITARVTVTAKRMAIVIADNGPGFDALSAEQAFQDPFFSTKGVGRGQGLLEISEAMYRLSAVADLAPEDVGKFRLRLTFPLEIK